MLTLLDDLFVQIEGPTTQTRRTAHAVCYVSLTPSDLLTEVQQCDP